MASKTRASRPSGTAISRSSAVSVSFAASASAAPNETPGAQRGSVKGGRLRLDRAVRPDDDLVDARLRLAKLRLAMTLQQRAALVGLNGVVELARAALEALDDLLELLERLLEAQLCDFRWHLWLGQAPSRLSRPLYGRACSAASARSGRHQGAHVGRGARAERGQVVAALERRYQPAAGMPSGALEQPL